MKCSKCGFEMNDNDTYCRNCGAPVETRSTVGNEDHTEVHYCENSDKRYGQNEQSYSFEKYQNNTNGYSAGQGPYGYGQTQYNNQQQYNGTKCPPYGSNQYPYGGNSAPGYNNAYEPDQGERMPKMKDYLKWMLLYPLVNLIPGVGFIAYIVMIIVMAFSSVDKARSEFFKAQCICMLIGVGVGVIITLIMLFVVDVTIPNIFEEFSDMNQYFDTLFFR